MPDKNQPFLATSFIKLIICTVIFLSACGTGLLAQQAPYRFWQIDQSDGLLQSDVNAIVQDGKGFIWILSSNGLQRYDGSRFVNYPYDMNNVNGVMDTRMAGLFADEKQNCLWLTSGQIQKFDLAKNSFSFYTADRILEDRNFKFQAYTDSNMATWVAGNFGIFKTYNAEKRFKPYCLSAPFLSPHKSNVYFVDAQNEQIWHVNYWTGLTLLDNQTKKIYTHHYNPINHPLLTAMDKIHLTSIMEDSEHNIWIGSGEQKFYRYNLYEKKLTTYSLLTAKNTSSNLKADVTVSVQCFFEDDHHTIWIGTENAGLLKYDREKDSFQRILKDENSAGGLRYNYAIWTIFQDREENIWLGTDKGINIFNPYRQYFQTIHHIENDTSSLPPFEINSVFQAANGDILTGTWGGGITVFDRNWQFKRHIRFRKPFEYNLVWSFIQNDDGTIWAGCQHGYIHIYNVLAKTIKTVHPAELKQYTIRCMAKDREGNIWMGLHDGKVAEWNKRQNKFYSYNDSTAGPAQSFSPVLTMFQDSKNRCWVGTENGFKEFDTKRRRYSSVYLPDKRDPQSISAYTIQSIEEYNDSVLMIGTAYGGLDYFNIVTRKFSHVTVNDGLPSSNIYSLKKDRENYVWFTTDYGLYKFRPGSNNYIHYTMQRGMVNSSFKSVGFCPLQNGKWLTATTSEIIAFDPAASVQQLNASGRVEITGFKVFEKGISIDSLLTIKKSIKLNYDQNFLTIEFAFLSFSKEQQNKYYYRLSGVNQDWVDAGTKNVAAYTNLQPGKYTFYVRVANGMSTTQSTSFTIVIRPPFWKTAWFYLLLGIASGQLIYVLVRWRLKSIRSIAAEKLKIEKLNTQQYKNQLELEQIVNYFSSSLINKNTVNEVLWDVAKNLIGRLGFVDCMIYLWNSDKTKMIQQAGFGPKGSIEEIEKNLFDVLPGQGVVGYVMQTKEPVLITDTSQDSRYRADEMVRLSEITVPIIYNDELVGVIDSEHHEKNFFRQQHIQIMNTIATLMATKIKSIESEQSLLQTKMEMMGINEKLSGARLEALRSQMNPHFIFNCLNSIDDLIQNNEKEKATEYLAKFAKLIRSILETSKNDVVPCWKDMETLNVYLELEGLRCDNGFSYRIEVAKEILNGDYKVPPLVIQPFVENAIHHGLLNKKEADRQLLIEVSVQDNCIHYTIEDNGVGRELSSAYNRLNKPAHQSMGMQITAERIHLFNQKSNGAIVITDLYGAQNKPAGTRVEIVLINP